MAFHSPRASTVSDACYSPNLKRLPAIKVRLFYQNRENLRKHKHSERDQRQARAKMVPLSGAGEYYSPAW